MPKLYNAEKDTLQQELSDHHASERRTTPLGEFRVNTYTTNDQMYPAIAGLINGGFAVTWSGDGQDGSGYGIYGQRYDASGVAQGAEFQVNTYTTNDQYNSAIAGLTNGGFVVTWQSDQDGSGYGVYGQRYDASGVAQGGEFRVNTYTTSFQYVPAIAALTDGGFVVTWRSDAQDGSYYGVYAQRYDGSGVAQGVEFRVNTYTTSNQWNAAVAALSTGGFVVTWESYLQDGSYDGVYAQRYDERGVAQDAEFRVNTYTTNYQYSPVIAALTGGGFAVTWQSSGQDGSGYGIYGQRYDGSGVVQGAEFRVNTYTTGDQEYYSSFGIAGLTGGGFVVTWWSFGQDGSSYGVYGQCYNASGAVQGGEFRVNTYTASYQQNPAIAGLTGEGFVVTWDSYGQDGSLYGVYAKTYIAPTLSNNQLTLSEGQTVVLTANDFSATDVDDAAGTLIFELSDVTQGRFEFTTNSGIAITQFTQQQIGEGQVQFTHDGGESAPSFTVSVSDGQLSTSPVPATIIFTNINDAPILMHNQLSLRVGETKILTPDELSAMDSDDALGSLLFNINDIQHGQFSFVSAPETEITIFYQQNITDSQVQFTHDGSLVAPMYRVSVSDGEWNTEAASADIRLTSRGVFPAVIELSSLDGTNGFVLNGVAAGDWSGISVSGIGDVNGDDMDDILIGAHLADPNGYDQAGESYVIFGGYTVGSIGSIELSTLNGTNGFVLKGEFAEGVGAASGMSVSGIGDVNADGYSDFIIGSKHADPAGRNIAGASYVIFGGPSIGSAGSIALSNLDGTNGCIIRGSVTGDQTGYSVSAAGDVNNDGISDLIIGAPFAAPGGRGQAGSGYVIFGSSTFGMSGIFELSSLNGINGFVLRGINALDWAGFKVSDVGDVNADGIDDLAITAPLGRDPMSTNAPSEGYVVFGGDAVGSNGAIELSSLDGTNGFKFSGIGDVDWDGYIITRAGDINNDGIDDLLISDHWASPDNRTNAGESYVIFGRSGLGASGVLSLSNLDGVNGCTLKGVAANDWSGFSGGSIGDINDDGIDDLIIEAFAADPAGRDSAGASYVVFGGSTVGSMGIIELSSLNGTNGFILNGVAAGDWSGYSVSFAGDINADGINDLIIGAPVADPAGRAEAGASYVVFGRRNISPFLLNHRMNISEGETLLLSGEHFSAADLNGHEGELIFSVSEEQQGQFIFVSQPEIAIHQFYQQNVTAAQVRFTHDGGEIAPSFAVSVSDGQLSTSPVPATIVFTNVNDDPSALYLNPMVLSENLFFPVIVGSLTTVDPDVEDTHTYQLVTGVGDSNNTQFDIVDYQLRVLTSFNYEQQQAAEVRIRTTDSAGSDYESAFVITILDQNDPPTDIDLTQTIVDEEQRVGTVVGVLSTADEDISDTHSYALVAGDTGNAFFEIAGDVLKTAAVLDYEIQQSLSVRIETADPGGATYQKSFNIVVRDINEMPVLLNHSVTLFEGEAIVLTESALSAIDVDDDPALSRFNISDVQHGQFSFVSSNTTIISFYQQNITDRQVQFTHDGGEIAPSFNLSVSDGQLSTSPVPATIVFTNINDAPRLTSTTTSNPIYIESELPVMLDDTVEILDPDSAVLFKAVVKVTDYFVPSEDVLTFLNQTDIAGYYDELSGTLSLSGNASIPNYQAALRSVKYHNLLDEPSGQNRTITFTVSDELSSSAVLERVIEIETVPDPVASSEAISTSEVMTTSESMSTSDALTTSVDSATSEGISTSEATATSAEITSSGEVSSSEVDATSIGESTSLSDALEKPSSQSGQKNDALFSLMGIALTGGVGMLCLGAVLVGWLRRQQAQQAKAESRHPYLLADLIRQKLRVSGLDDFERGRGKTFVEAIQALSLQLPDEVNVQDVRYLSDIASRFAVAIREVVKPSRSIGFFCSETLDPTEILAHAKYIVDAVSLSKVLRSPGEMTVMGGFATAGSEWGGITAGHQSDTAEPLVELTFATGEDPWANVDFQTQGPLV